MDETDRHDDGFTVSRGWRGDVVGVRHAEVVYILEEKVTNLPILKLMAMLITKNDNDPR